MNPPHDLLAEVVDQLPVGVRVLGADERVTGWNAAAERSPGGIGRPCSPGRPPTPGSTRRPSLELVAGYAARPLDELCDHLVRQDTADTGDGVVVQAVRLT